MNHKGFTLIEVLVVAAITGFLSTVLILNFARTRVNLYETANVVMSNIRIAQSNAVSSTKYGAYIPCGYGIHYVNTTQYAIYAGPNAATTTCSSINRNYQSNEDTIIATYTFNDTRVQFKAAFNDIFFEPPDPKTYLNNNSSLNQAPISISIGEINKACPQYCKTILMYSSGKAETP